MQRNQIGTERLGGEADPMGIVQEIKGLVWFGLVWFVWFGLFGFMAYQPL